MKDKNKTKAQLVEELARLRGRVTELEAAEALRQRVEEALRESEERFFHLFERIPVGLYRTTPAGRILEVNPAMVQLLAYPDRESLLAANAVDIYADPEDRARCLSLVEREEVIYDFETQMRRGDGAVIWVRDAARAIRDSAGGVLCYEGSLEDISERKRAEEELRRYRDHLEELVQERTADLEREISERKQAEKALRESEETARALLQAPTDSVILIDRQGIILDLNETAARRFNRSIDELVGVCVYDLVPTEVAERRRAQRDQVIRSGKPVRYEDGRAGMHFDTIGYPIFAQGEVARIAIVARDISERKRAEAALRESEERLKLALAAANDGLYDWNMQTGEVYFSPRYYTMLDYEPYELPPSYDTWVSLLHPDDRELALNTVREHVEENRDSHEIEFRMRLKSGGWRWVLSRGRTVERDASGRPVRMVGTHVDITERKLMEDALREREERLRRLFETMTEGVVLISPGGQIVQANLAAEHILGLKRPEIRGRSYVSSEWDILRPDGTPMPPEEMAGPRAMKEKRLVKGVVMGVRRPNGSVSWINVSAAPVIAESGEIEGVVGTFADVSEGKRAEEKIRYQAETLAALHETALDLAAQRDLPDLLQAIVDRAVALLGASAGGVYLYRPASDDLELALQLGRGTTTARVVLQRGESLSGKVLESGRSLAVADYSRWEGRSERLEAADLPACVAVPISWGDRPLGVLSLADEAPRSFSPGDVALLERFTPLAAAALENARLLDAERKRRQIAETLQQASATLSSTLELDELLQLILQRLQQVIPYDSASIQRLQEGALEIIACQGFAKPDKVVGLRFPLDPKFPNDEVVKTGAILALGDVAQDYPHFIGEADTYESGHIRSWLGVPLLAKDRVIGMIALDRVTVQPYTPEEAQLALTFAHQATIALENARLHQDLQQQMEQLKQTQLQLVQSAKLAAVGELAAGVAHELNNPLTFVLGFAEMLQKTADLEPPHRENLEAIVEGAERARDIVRALLDFARQTRPQRRPADVNQLLQQTLAVIRYHLEKSGVVIEEDYAVDLGLLSLDEGQVKQVLLNLINNAFQAMPAGGTLSLRTARVGGEVAVSIRDTGVGISPQDQERIFDPFFSTRPSGTGLGLSISLGLIQEHGGRITVESEEGKGSTFTVWLPLEGE